MKGSVRKWIVALAMVGLMLAGAACDAESRQFVIDIAMSWAADHAIDIGQYALWGSSGNDEVDAVMEAKGVISNIQEADKLMEEGRRDNDQAKMEAAIKKRPGDYTYRVSYGSSLLRGGRTEDAAAQFQAADEAVTNYGGYHAQNYAIQGIDELSLLQEGFEKTGFADAQQCQLYYSRMAFFYGLRYEDTKSDYFQSQQTNYATLADQCP